jgi:hypothetical protein
LPAEATVKVPIRRVSIVIDVEDPLTPVMTLEEFKRISKKESDSRRYRVVAVEMFTCPDDQQPMLVTECKGYRRFIRRNAEFVYLWETE